MVERQSFINVTEELLEEELESKVEEPEEAEEAVIVETEQEDPLEIFNKQKVELSKNINTALNETSLLLDFVSLLMSSVKPNLAKATISPHLTKNVPLGSLNSDRLTQEEDQDKPTNDNSRVGQGWKLESLKKITTLFKNSSMNLKEQVTKEKQYWNMINLVLSHDEVLFKTKDPLNGSRAIGVKYGYGDSGSNFHDKGLAVLRKDNATGEITFVPTTSSKVSKVYKYIRIKILSEIDDDFMLTGQSVFENTFEQSKDKVINDIEKARFFLFEEDLFYQLIREAKSLNNYYVSIISNKIIIQINHEIIEIESVVYDESNDDELNNYYQNINSYSAINNTKCQLILNYLKIMLCCYYNYNLKLKQKIPTALTKWKQSNSHPLILRPLLGNIRHEINIKSMNQILASLSTKYESDVECTQTVDKFANLKTRTGNPFQKSIEKPLSRFLVKVKSEKNGILKIALELTTNENFVNLIINLSIIKYHDEEDFESDINGVNVLQISFNDFNDIEECLDWSVLNHTAS